MSDWMHGQIQSGGAHYVINRDFMGSAASLKL